jgi:nitroreductase
MDQSVAASETLLRQMQWRCAVKKFDPRRKVPGSDWQTLEKAVVLSPSSYGLQPWRLLVVNAMETRMQLQAASWNQPQVVESSHFVVFAVKKHLSRQDVEAYLDRIVAVRRVAKESLGAYRDMMVGDLVEGPRSAQLEAWATRQAYLALGVLLMSAAQLGIDACPMEGFQPDRYDHILGLDQRGLATAVACALGYRAEDDSYSRLAKVRFKDEDLIERI